MKRKIFGSMILLSIITIFLATAMFSTLIHEQMEESMMDEIRSQMAFVTAGYRDGGMEYLQEIRKENQNTRITLIDMQGVVLYDNRAVAAEMENHKDRPEVQSAMKNGQGESIRNSDTVGSQLFYLAEKLEDGNILRLSIQTEIVWAAMKASLGPIIGIAFLIILLALIFSKIQTRRIIKPINEIDLEHPLGEQVYDELAPLIFKINKLNHSVQEKMKELSERTDSFTSITAHMEEGLIILDKSGKIVTINQSGAIFFHSREEELIGRHFSVASRNLKLIEAVELAMKGDAQEENFEERGKNFQFRATPVLQEGEVTGGILMIFDVTEKRKTEMMRREFTANVSHELKTPLTAILGYAEMLKNRMAEGEDAVDFAGRIHGEARGLLFLIEDIIRLSQMDEGIVRMPMETVNLMALASVVKDRLHSSAARKNIQLEVIGNSEMVQGVPSMLEELLMNLVDNGIKYNTDGGKVTIRIWKEQGKIFLEVEDTGIGIPKEHQERIFERFYRVDKSHSKNTGGTGLGLSIVKHIAEYHHASLRLVSEAGKGTNVLVEFQAV